MGDYGCMCVCFWKDAGDNMLSGYLVYRSCSVKMSSGDIYGCP